MTTKKLNCGNWEIFSFLSTLFCPFEGRERSKHFLATWRDKDNRETEKSKKTKGKRTKISILIFVYLKVFIVFENHFALMKVSLGERVSFCHHWVIQRRNICAVMIVWLMSWWPGKVSLVIGRAIGTSVDQGIASNVIMTIIGAQREQWDGQCVLLPLLLLLLLLCVQVVYCQVQCIATQFHSVKLGGVVISGAFLQWKALPSDKSGAMQCSAMQCYTVLCDISGTVQYSAKWHSALCSAKW